MFGFFKKKEEKQEPTPTAVGEEYGEELRSLGAKFRPEEMSILAVTGANGFGGRRVREDGPWIATLELTAWKEEDGEEPVCQEKTLLVALAGDKLLAYLRRRAMPDSIIQVTVRPSEDRTSFLMTELPQLVMDPELKAILDEQKKPDSTYVEGLGTFVLNRQVGWYQADVDWLGQSIQLVYDRGSGEEVKAAHQTALALMGAQEDWDSRVRTYAAQQLPVQHPGLEDEMLEVPAEELARRLEPESLQVWPDGSFEFWFHDADYQWEHALRVCGTVAGGPEHVYLEG